MQNRLHTLQQTPCTRGKWTDILIDNWIQAGKIYTSIQLTILELTAVGALTLQAGQQERHHGQPAVSEH